MARALYTLLVFVLLPLALARLWWRGRREPGYRRHVGERLGRYGMRSPRPVIWVHAVSVGEARAAAPLVDALRRTYPDHDMLVTCTTAAGRDTVLQVFGNRVQCVFLPYDLPFAIDAFLGHFAPRLGVIMETEIWPNLLARAAARGVRLVLANARLSAKSARGYSRIAWLARPAFAALDAVCAQSEVDAVRLRAAGAQSVQVTGNLKFDVTPDPALLHEGRALRQSFGERGVLLLASSRDTEEQMFLDALRDAGVAAAIVIVPRHPQRFDTVAGLLRAQGWRVAHRSKGDVPGDGVYLGDTMGEMPLYYAACDVALIGGSFAPLGGQNLIEALASGAPVVCGPSMFNFDEAARLALSAGAARQARDMPAAIREAVALLGDDGERARMVAAGHALLDTHRGATERHITRIGALLPP